MEPYAHLKTAQELREEGHREGRGGYSDEAAGNPKVMAAVQDVMQNGPGAMKKYENDREVKAILDELKGIL